MPEVAFSAAGPTVCTPSLLRNHQQLPDHCLGVIDALEAARRVCSQPHLVERRLHDVGGAKMHPVLLGVVEEAHHALPISAQRCAGLGIGLLEAQHELIAPLNAPHLMREVYEGKPFTDGVAVQFKTTPTRKAA